MLTKYTSAAQIALRHCEIQIALFNPTLINSMILDRLFRARQSIHENSFSLCRITDDMVSSGLVSKVHVLGYVFRKSARKLMVFCG